MDSTGEGQRAPRNLFRRGPTWYARFSVNGELQRVSLRTTDLREARARYKGLKKQAEHHAFGIAGAPTWDIAAEAYVVAVLNAGALKPGTAKRYAVSLRQIHGYMTGRKLPTITIAEIANYADARRKAGATNATIRRDLTTMSRVFALARSKGIAQTNPAAEYDRSLLREKRSPIEAPPDAAVDAAAEAALAAGAAELGMLIGFLRATGMRSGEALRARWEHIHDGDLTIHETKNGRARTIPLAAAPLPPQRTSGRLFPGLPATSADLASRWQWIKRSLPAGQQFRLHDLRHAYAIAEIRKGRDIYDLSHHLGHSSVKVTEVYLGYASGNRSKSRHHEVTQKVTQGFEEEAEIDPKTAGRKR